jgi:hypothetical protein
METIDYAIELRNSTMLAARAPLAYPTTGSMDGPP